MRLRWTRPALADLAEAQSFIAANNPQAARDVAQRVWDAAAGLSNYPDMGRPGHVPDTREWVVSRTPYLIAYRVKNQTVEILRVWHTHRNWRDSPAE